MTYYNYNYITFLLQLQVLWKLFLFIFMFFYLLILSNYFLVCGLLFSKNFFYLSIYFLYKNKRYENIVHTFFNILSFYSIIKHIS